MDADSKYLAAIVGAGPAGLFAARELASQGVHVALINRDIKPGGLAEYGIYFDKHKMKEGLRAQFRQILALDQIDYYGNVTVGEQGDLTLAELRGLGFQAILITAGAQGTKWLGLPGENLEGVYHAKDLVYHYNLLPPFSQREFHIGRKVAIIGAGNVMLDITRYLSTLNQVEEVIAIIRRGPAEVRFSHTELEHVARLLDLGDLEAEIERVSPTMRALGENPEEFARFVHQAIEKSDATSSKARFVLRFLESPIRILSDGQGRVNGLEIGNNTLVEKDGEVIACSLDTHQVLEVDTVIFAIGDKVDTSFGLPIKGLEYYKCPNPRFPVEGISYEIADPISNQPIKDLFVAGWSRQASTGLVGLARRDGSNGAKAMLEYLQTLPPLQTLPRKAIEERMHQMGKPVVRKQDLAKLELVERERAQLLGVEEFKFGSNQEMLSAMGLLPEP